MPKSLPRIPHNIVRGIVRGDGYISNRFSIKRVYEIKETNPGYRFAKSIFLYASPFWKATLRLNMKKNMFSIVCRSCLRDCSAYRTISLEASCVVADISPIDLAARVYMCIEEPNPEYRLRTERSNSALIV